MVRTFAGSRGSSSRARADHASRRTGIDDRLVTKLTSGLPDNYLAALTELYVNFHGARAPLPRYAACRADASRAALEPRTFSLQTPRTFHTLYAPPDRNAKEVVEQWQSEIAWMSKAVCHPSSRLVRTVQLT